MSGIKPFIVALPHLERLPELERAFGEIAGDSAVETIDSCRFGREPAAGLDRSRLILHNVSFDHTRFERCRLRGVRMYDVLFDRCDLSMVDFGGASLHRVAFVGCKLQGADLSNATVRDLTIRESAARFVNFSMSDFRNVRFDRSDLRGGIFISVRQRNLLVERCDLSECDFSQTRLAGTDLCDSSIDGITVAPDDLRGAIVTPWQAASLARLMGLIVRE